MPREPGRGRDERSPQRLRRLVHATAAFPLLVSLALLPAFLDGTLPGRWAGPAYLGLFSLTVLVGSPAVRGGSWAVPSVAILGLLSAGAWGYGLGPIPVAEIAQALDAWRLALPTGASLPAWWPLAIAVPAVAVVLVEALRGEPGLVETWGNRGGLEGLPGRAGLFGWTALAVGVAGTLFAGSTFLEKVAVVAPIFEEYAKLGVALLAVASLGLSRGAPAFALGSLAGLTFGLLEHNVTYSSEPQLMFVVRVLFHTLAAGLSALVYVHLRRREDLEPGAAWLAIVPSALVHAANNVTAIGVAVASLVSQVPEILSPLLGGVFVLTLVVAVLVTAVNPDSVCGRIERFWRRLNGERDRARLTPWRWS